MHRQFGCPINVGALQAQTVEAPGSDLLLDPVSRRVRQDDLADVPLEDNLQGGDGAYHPSGFFPPDGWLFIPGRLALSVVVTLLRLPANLTVAGER